MALAVRVRIRLSQYGPAGGKPWWLHWTIRVQGHPLLHSRCGQPGLRKKLSKKKRKRIKSKNQNVSAFRKIHTVLIRSTFLQIRKEKQGKCGTKHKNDFMKIMVRARRINKPINKNALQQNNLLFRSL